MCGTCYARWWRHKNPERRQLADTKYLSSVTGRAQRRGNIRRRTYGVTQEQIERMIAEQGGVCAVCPEPIIGESVTAAGRILPRAYVDHNHVDGSIRGMLCMRCNSGLGLFRETPELLEAAASYLRRWQ